MIFWCFEFTPQKFINFSWEVEFVWEGCTRQEWGGVLQETEGFSSLGGVFLPPRGQHSDFCRDRYFQPVEMLWGRTLCAFPAFMISLFYLQNSLILSELIQRKSFSFRQDRPERQNLCPDFNCSQKCRHTRPQTAVQQVASCELTLLTLQYA